MAGFQIGDVGLVVRHSIAFMVSGIHLFKTPPPQVQADNKFAYLRNC